MSDCGPCEHDDLAAKVRRVEVLARWWGQASRGDYIDAHEAARDVLTALDPDYEPPEPD